MLCPGDVSEILFCSGGAYTVNAQTVHCVYHERLVSLVDDSRLPKLNIY